MSQTILFLIADAHGHVNALASIIRELKHRNKKVIILFLRQCDPADKMRARGFQVEILGDISRTEEVQTNIFGNFDKLCNGAVQTMDMINDVILDWYAKINDRYEEFKAKLESLNPDLIVIDHVLLSPWILLSGKPWVRFYSIFPSYLYAKYNKQLVAGLGLKLTEMNPSLRAKVEQSIERFAEVRKFYTEKGTADWGSNDWLIEPVSPYLNFYLGPQELGYENEPGVQPLPDTFVRLEHTIDEPELDSEFEIPEKFSTLPGKLIYFSLGTVASFNVELMNKMTGILSKSPHRFIVSMGVHHEQVKLYPNMWGAKYVNQKTILPNVDLFITHGGHNSTIEAFHYGVPHIIVLPAFCDQYDSAQRVAECGFAIKLDPFNCSEEDLLSAIETKLADDDTPLRMTAISSRLRSIKFHEICADRLEVLLTRSTEFH